MKENVSEANKRTGKQKDRKWSFLFNFLKTIDDRQETERGFDMQEVREKETSKIELAVTSNNFNFKTKRSRSKSRMHEGVKLIRTIIIKIFTE